MPAGNGCAAEQGFPLLDHSRNALAAGFDTTVAIACGLPTLALMSPSENCGLFCSASRFPLAAGMA
jgi:hypothetical protein